MRNFLIECGRAQAVLANYLAIGSRAVPYQPSESHSVASTALTPEGLTGVPGGRQDHWTYNSEGFLVPTRFRATCTFNQNKHVQCPSRNLRTIGEHWSEDNNNEDITDICSY